VVFVSTDYPVLVEVRRDGFSRFVVFEDLLARDDQVGMPDDVNPVPRLREPLFLDRVRVEVSLFENFVGDLPPEGPVQLAWRNVSFVKLADEDARWHPVIMVMEISVLLRSPVIIPAMHVQYQQAEVGVVGKILQRQGWRRRLGEVGDSIPSTPPSAFERAL
jgi:hypothetical protein